MSEHRILTAHPGDAERLAAFGARAFAAAFASQNTPEDMAAYLAANFSEAVIAEELADPASFTLLLLSGCTLLGYARLVRGAAQESVPAANPIELNRIYVDPARTGLGLGARLLQACLEAAESGGHDVVWLGVWERNIGAIRFYQRWGFEKTGEQAFRLGNDLQNDWVMARPVRLEASA